jgi:competence protein ComEC
MVAVVRLAAEAPFASLEVRGLGSTHAVAYYALLGAGVWLLARRRSASATLASTAPAGMRALPVASMATILLLSAALAWLAISAPASGRLSVTFLDVGQGDAILIEGPDGHRILVDGGPGEEAITNALGRRLPFYDRRIDLVVLTHPQLDHFGGLPAVLERYDVRRLLVSPLEGESASYRAWAAAVRRSSIPHDEAARGQAIDLGDGATLHVLAAPARASDPNEASVVIRLQMGAASFLLTGDSGPAAEATLVRSGADLRATVYKVPHHGSATSASAEMLAAVAPLIDVISVGRGNPFGHPTGEVLARLDGDAVFRTDVDGDVSVSTDGRRLWVRTGR